MKELGNWSIVHQVSVHLAVCCGVSNSRTPDFENEQAEMLRINPGVNLTPDLWVSRSAQAY